MHEVVRLCEETKRATAGYFDAWRNGTIDPSGLVKGWAIHNCADRIGRDGFINYYVEAGGDIEAHGKNAAGEPWSVGIRNPFDTDTIVKVLAVTGMGVATSGTYLRGQHVYNPLKPGSTIDGVVSLTVIGPDAYEADRFATAAFAMGLNGINFVQDLGGFEGYMIEANGRATYTDHFLKYVIR